MRRHLILTISLLVNIALVAAWLTTRRQEQRLLARSTNAAPAISNVFRTHVVVRKQFFSWQELESTNYRSYISNLFEIGCPPLTVRDIIVADVNQLFAKRRATEVVTPEQQWWRYDADTNVMQAANAKLYSLEQERRALLTSLLGPNWAMGETPPGGVALDGPLLADLSPETKQAVQDIIARSTERTQAYLDAQQQAGKQADPIELARLSQQMRTELAQVLNPAQLEEFLLRYSQTAASLRERLRGLDLSPDEFRSLFLSTDSLEQKFDSVVGDSAGKASQQASLAKQMDDAIKNVLGADRYKTYLTMQEPAYQDAASLGEENGATLPEVRALYELNKATLAEQQRIKNDDSLTPEQKTAQLDLVQKQQAAASDRILGLAPDNTPLPGLPPPAQVYTYPGNETVEMIAAKYGVSASAILSANPTLNFRVLTPGTSINIPPPPSQQ